MREDKFLKRVETSNSNKFYILFDIYICKNDIESDENNKDCSSYEKIIRVAKENNSFKKEIFYPEVYYQPNN